MTSSFYKSSFYSTSTLMFVMALGLALFSLTGSAESNGTTNIGSESGYRVLQNIEPELLLPQTISRLINLTPAIISQEIAQLSSEKYLISEAELSILQKTVLAKFHPNELKSSLLKINALKNNNSNILAIKNYNAFLQSTESKNLDQLYNETINTINQDNVLAYQKKIKQAELQAVRKKLLKVYDTLNHTSELQTALIYAIQQEIHKHLSKQDKAHYLIPNKTTLYQKISTYNQTIYLYSFKYIDSQELIRHLDNLYLHKKILNDLSEQLKESLVERAKLTLKIPHLK